MRRSVGQLAHLGRRYVLAETVAASVFHPELMARLSERGGRVWIGSGNLTYTGWGGNRELAASWPIGPGEEDGGAWLDEALGAVSQVISSTTFSDQLRDIREEIPWLTGRPAVLQRSPVLLGMPGRPLAQQLADRWRGRHFDELRLCTGSTDVNGAFLAWAHRTFGVRRATVCLGALIGLLRRGELEAQGLPATPGHPLTILRPVWSHRDFHFNSDGDVFQLNYECEDPHIDRLTRRWSAVVLQRGQIPDAAIQSQSEGALKAEASAEQAEALPSASAGAATISAADIFDAGTLANALTRLIFKHPEVQALRASAAAAANAAHVLFEESAGLIAPVYGHDEPLLPLRFFPKKDWDFGMPDDPESIQEEVADWGGIADSMPREVTDCYGAINARAAAVFGLLQDREVIGFGHTVDGHFVEIARTIWSHEDFYIHPPTGDIYEASPGKMTRRWTGVVLMLPGHASSAARFHVKPIPSDPVRPTTAQRQFGLVKPESAGKAIAGAEARKTSREACGAWLEEFMRASPTERRETKQQLWEKAQQKWPGTLSKRAFIAAWGQAIDRSGAIAWSTAGAPRKPKQKQSPHRNRRAD